MIEGEIIGRYRIATAPQLAGRCMWAFADSLEEHSSVFIKEFLDPVVPLPDAPGSPAAKKRARAECDAFENRHRSIMEAIGGAVGRGGNLIYPLELFRHGSRFYKVTERIDTASLSHRDLSTRTWEHRKLVMLTICHSLSILHRNSIVHGDLKPDNILLKQTSSELVVAKIIDFDDSYFVGSPPPPEDLIGDLLFYAPETANYVIEESADPGSLTCAADVFSLGLIFSNIIAGQLPGVPPGYHYPGEAVLAGNALDIRTVADAPEVVMDLIYRMVDRSPKRRPSVRDVFIAVKDNLLERPIREPRVSVAARGLTISPELREDRPRPDPVVLSHNSTRRPRGTLRISEDLDASGTGG